MTAANDAAMSSVKLLGSSPMMGAASTPHRPAKKVLTAQTPTEMVVGLVPERSVIAGESTIALTLRPTSVYRSTAAPTATVSTTQMYTMIWSKVTGYTEELVDVHGLRCQPGRRLNGLVAEDQCRQGRERHQETDRRHHLDQR